MSRVVIFFGLLCLVLGACVPRQKVMYLQNGDRLEEAVKHDKLEKPDKFVYKLSSGDILSVKLVSITPEKYNLQTLNGESNQDPILTGYIIDNKGYIDIPYIGKLLIKGLTINEARELIKREAKDKLINPFINVKLLSYSYTVLGEVNQPGSYNSYKDEITIFEAIGSAGDLTDFAERGYVKIIRSEGDSISVNYVDLLHKGVVSSKYYYLRPGDFIYVPPMKVKNFTKFQLPNLALGVSILTVISLFFIRLN